MIFVDVTSFLNQPSPTGIQRVVAEVISRIATGKSLDLALLHYDMFKGCFDLLTEDQVARSMRNGERNLDFHDNGNVRVEDFREGDVFFDLDCAWDDLTTKRTILYPLLKERGVVVATYIYDLNPVYAPEAWNVRIVTRFCFFLAAALKFADVIVSETASVLKEIDELKLRLGQPLVPGHPTWLGCDFVRAGNETFRPDGRLLEATRGRFVLMVGTLQPLKNHKVVLDAFDKALFKRGLNLVIAGKTGWCVDDLVERIRTHSLFEKQLFHFEKLDDQSINYLYKNAFCLAFSSIREGFGLPSVEALRHGTPVLASDIPVLREVGGDYCRYFAPHSPDSFIEALSPWLESDLEYAETRRKVSTYKPVTWDDVAENVASVLRKYHPHRDGRSFHRCPASCRHVPYAMGREVTYAPEFRGLSFDLCENMWTSSRHVAIPLELSGDLDDLFLSIGCTPFTDNQPCEIKGNGVKLARIVVERRTSHVFRIPRHAFDKSRRIVLEFLLPNAISPKEAGVADDRRLLGLLLESLRIVKGAELFSCEPNKTYYFGSEEGATARRFFPYGLSHIEEGFSWSSGGSVKMLVKPQGHRCGGVSFKIRYGTFLPRERVVVYANGRRLTCRRLKGEGDFKFTVPAKTACAGARLSLKFLFPDAASPLELGQGPDPRKLGIRFYSFSVKWQGQTGGTHQASGKESVLLT